MQKVLAYGLDDGKIEMAILPTNKAKRFMKEVFFANVRECEMLDKNVSDWTHLFDAEIEFLKALDALPEWWIYKGHSLKVCIESVENSGADGWIQLIKQKS